MSNADCSLQKHLKVETNNGCIKDERLLKIGSLKNWGKPLSAIQGFLSYMPEHGLQFQRTCGSPIRRLVLGYQTHLLARGLHKVHQTD